VKVLGVVIVAGLAFWLSVILGLWPVDAASDPSALETEIAERAMDASVARASRGVRNPFPVSDELLVAGAHIYRDNCAGCHGGADGRPAEFGLSFYPRAPQFPKDPPRDPEERLHWIVANGVRRTGMSAWAKSKLISDRDIWAVVSFVRRIDSLPPAALAEWKKTP